MGRVVAVLSSQALHSDREVHFGTEGSEEGPVHTGSDKVEHTGPAAVGMDRIGPIGVGRASEAPPGISLEPNSRFDPSHSA